MRLLQVALALALTAPALAGCITPLTPGATSTATGTLGLIEVPAGATLVEESAGRAILRWTDVDLPFQETFALPEGVTMVRAVATLADAVSVSATMWNEETGRRRCNTDRVDLWDVPVVGTSTCSGLAAIDPPGTVWVARATGALASAATVDIVFDAAPLDGLAAMLDLTQLSMGTFDVTDTQYLEIPSFDGTSLWVEVTLPDGEGPWPTVLASSPYNGRYGRGDTPAMWTYFTHDWAKRGYAVVNADVRGFGMSGGCVEVWGINEQKDQAFLVDWVAEQDWSDGNVGFYGQSYVATTPVAAAVQAPDALKAIIAVAPVMDAYYDWHYGGVPNGESSLSPVAYQVLTDTAVAPGDPMSVDPVMLATLAPNGICDPTLVVRANDPRAIYDAFYVERNFSARAADIKAAVLYTQGFEDSNVKSAMIPGWFNDITAPKLGLFGHWVHQHPTRADEEILFLGWMDQYVKGKPVGFDKLPAMEVVATSALSRTGSEWPPTDAVTLALQANVFTGELAPVIDGDGDVDLVLAPATGVPDITNLPVGTGLVNPVPSITFEYPIEADLAIAGIPALAITGLLRGAANAHFYADLYDVDEDGKSGLVTYGMFNLAHRNGHDKFEPATAAAPSSFELPFLPTEHVFPAGHTLRVVLRGVTADESIGGAPPPGAYSVSSGEATRLLLPTIDIASYAPVAASATP